VGTIGTPTTINSGDMQGILMIAARNEVLKLEAEVRQGALPQGMPRLNPANAS
jgi:hypothetical protein